MASLAMASFMTVSSLPATCACSVNSVFSSVASVRMVPGCVAPVRRVGVSSSSRNLHVVASATPQSSSLEGAVEEAIKEANEICAAEDNTGNCAAAWDEVEELAAAVAHKKVSDKDKKDPLEQFCKEVPEADECRVYEE